MSLLDTGIAIAFSLIVFVLGVSFARSGSNVKSFFAAGGAVPWWISGLSLFMSFFSVGTFVVWGAIAYNTGLVAVIIQATMSIAGFVVGFFIAPRWNRTKALTAAQFIAERLGIKTQKFYTLVFLLISIFGSGAFLYPVGKMLEVTAGIPLSVSISLLGMLIIIYTAVGGLWAVLVTDVLQFVVLTAAVLIVVPLAFIEVGGVSQFINVAPANFFALTNAEYDGFFLAAFGFYNMVFIGGSWAYVQRYTSVKNAGEARKVGILFGALYLIAPLIWMLPPMIYRVINPDLDAAGAEGAYMLVSQLVVPDGLMGLILVAMVFATASSVNTTLNIAAGVFTNDVYKAVKANVSDREAMRVARLATVIFGCICIWVALSVADMGGIVEVVFSLAAITGVALFLPPVWAMFSKVQTGKSVVTVTILSLTVNGVFKFVTPVIWDFSLSRSPEMMVGVLVPILLLSLFEISGRMRVGESQQYQQYMAQWSTKHPRQSQREVADSASANVFARKVIGIGILAVAILLLALGLQASQGSWIIILMAVITGAASLLVFPGKLSRSALSKVLSV
ncbi:sodium:solute symporter family protein [Thalassotalea mangrovi]|uniref:Sodium transporter n=1 Tax=Thalassotalea mangrovi TaxID=2572245 RepID=A0A4U1B211_9GAMM|nr:sodium:solute symporter family protein [Thalassotalea mangrovi]TKB43065.1 sodium transporter [Thalassotalea mangrovi]